MSILILLGFFIAWCIITLKDQLTPPAPPIKDWDRFMKESRDKSPREVRRMIRSGEYSEEPVSKNDTKSINNPYLQHQATEDEIRPVIKYSDEDIAIAQRIEQQYNKRFEEELCAFRLQAELNRTKDVDDVIIAASESNQCVDFNSMSGEQFEFFCSELLAKNEFTNIELTKHSGDQGIDIIAIKDGLKYGIQCKCYSSPVGNHSVQEVYSGMAYYDCHIGVVLTNNYFTPSAKELANKLNILLWDKDFLDDLISHAKDDDDE